MTSSTLIVLAFVHCKPDQVEKALPILETFTVATRTEPGCLKFEMYQDLADETIIMFEEEFTGEDALQAHYQLEHFKQAVAAMDGLTTKPVEVFRYKRIV